jgi:serine protease AprX
MNSGILILIQGIKPVAIFLNRNLLRLAVIKLLLFFASGAIAQTNYLIYLTDKNDSPYSAEHPEAYLSGKALLRRSKQKIPVTRQDFPVNPQYLKAIKDNGAICRYASRWLNALLVTGTEEQMVNIRNLGFVKSVLNLDKDIATGTEYVNIQGFQAVTAPEISYGNSFTHLSMLGIDIMHSQGLNGKGITIAVLDDGFRGVTTHYGFDSLRSNNRIKATFDFHGGTTNVYEGHDHGTAVLSLMGAYKEGELIGGAWNADFMLLKTEVIEFEKQLEEVYWLLGAEFADSAGADIIQSSLGYNVLDDDGTTHTYQDLDGKRSIVTTAAEFAFSKGMLVVNSAGNEGSSSWRYLNVPADGKNVLTVGAVKADRSYYPISSVGPTSDMRIKPDVAAMGNNVPLYTASGLTPGNGTSFAAPLISAFAANLWQKLPDLTNRQLFELIRNSGSQASSPDNYLGSGIPDYMKARNILGTENGTESKDLKIFPNPAENIITIESGSSKIESMKILSVSGKEVLKMDFSAPVSSADADISDLPAGFYYSVFITDQGNKTLSFIIVR